MVYTVVPNWNGREHIGDCLRSLQKQSQKTEIIVVDNGSIDGSQEYIRKTFPKVTLIELTHNHGFAGGVNAGIKRAMTAGAEYVALFNNDAVADKDWVKNLLKTAKLNSKTGIVTCKFMRAGKARKFDSTGEMYSIWGFPFPRGRDKTDEGQFDQTEVMFGATGGASLYRVEVLEEIGLFDEDFFAYYEDVDLSFRAQLAGWKVMYEPSATADHLVGATSSKLPNFARFHTVKNYQYLYIKNMPGWLFWKYMPRFLVGYGLIFANCLLKGQFLVFLKADATAFRTGTRTWRKRREIQKNRKVSASYIDSLLYKSLPPHHKLARNS